MTEIEWLEDKYLRVGNNLSKHRPKKATGWKTRKHQHKIRNQSLS